MNKDLKTQEIVNSLLDKGFLLTPDLETAEQISLLLQETNADDALVLTLPLMQAINKGNCAHINWKAFETALFHREQDGNAQEYLSFFECIRQRESLNQEPVNSPVTVIFSENEEPQKHTVDHFVSYFNTRFRTLEGFLRTREELSGTISISRLVAKKAKENVAIIGMVSDKQETKNNNIILTLEDRSGSVSVLVSKTKQELFNIAKDIVLDEVIGISGMSGNKIVFANSILLPDIPLTKEMKKGKDEVWCAFLGDMHVGAKVFLKSKFIKMMSWLNGTAGSAEQKRIASKIKYLFIVGDLVEGVGIYPGQEDDLEIKEVKQQYDEFMKYLDMIPEHINVVLCPGNHDAGRISEPQPEIYRDYASGLYARKNVLLVSNPGLVNIESSPGFSGFDVLLYHGYSLIYYSENVPSIRAAGGQKRPDLIMKHLLTRRHLAPTHTSNLYIPYPTRDPLLITRVPDFFVTGHIHRISASNYRGVTLLNCSCWTAVTEDQEKRGLEPQPAKLPVVNLQTREVKILNFMGADAGEDAE